MPLTRATFGILRFAIGLAPVAIVAFRAGVYLVQVGNYLSAPGAPVRWPIHSPRGDLILTADSYAFDARQGIIHLAHPRLNGPDGRTLARVNSIDLRVTITSGRLEQVVAVVDGLDANVRREQDGRFEFQGFLPRTKQAPSTMRFDVIVRNARIAFEDRTLAKDESQFVTAPSLHVAGVGDGWTAVVSPTIAGCGVLPLTIDHASNGETLVSAHVKSAQLGDLVRRYGKLLPKDVADLNVGAIAVTGPMTAWLDVKQKPHFRVPIAVNAHKVRWRGYDAAAVVLSGNLTEMGWEGQAKATNDGLTASFTGSARWDKTFTLNGDADATVRDLNAIPGPIRSPIPKPFVALGVKAHGRLLIEGTHQSWDGWVSADSIRYERDHLDKSKIAVRYRDGDLKLDVRQGSTLGYPLRGLVAIDLKKKTVKGIVKTERRRIDAVVKRFGIEGLAGEASAEAKFSGPFDHLQASIALDGSARYHHGERGYDLGDVHASARFNDGSWLIDRAWIDGDHGLLSATGTISRKGMIAIDVVGRGLDPQMIDRRLEGAANMRGQIRATLDNPKFTGLVEAYSLRFDEWTIPAIRSQFTVDRRTAEIHDLHAIRGATELEGHAAYAFASRALSGEMKIARIRLAELLDENYVGSFDIPKVTLDGTVEHPNIVASITSKRAVVRGIKLESVAAEIDFDGDVAHISQSSAQIGNGSIAATGNYRVSDQIGHIEARLGQIPIDGLTANLPSEVTVTGSIDGRASGDFDANGLTATHANGSARNVVVNGVLIGSGAFHVAGDPNAITGDVELGQIERYVRVKNARYVIASGEAGADLEAYNLRLAGIAQGSMRYIDSADVRAMLQQVDAEIDIDAHVALKDRDASPSVSVRQLLVNNVMYRNKPVGSLTAAASRDNGRWTIQKFAVSGPLLAASVGGSLAEMGSIDLSGEVSHLDLEKLGEIEPRAARLTGMVDLVSFVATGPLKSPVIKASAEVSNLLHRPGESADQGLRVDLSEISIAEATGVSVVGRYFFRGFTGDVEASAPIRYAEGLPEGAPISGRVSVVQRRLSEIAALAPGLDPKRSDGLVGGEIKVSGTIADPQLDGHVELVGGTLRGEKVPCKLGFQNIDDSLINMVVKIGLTHNAATAHVEGDWTRGGRIAADASVPAPQIDALFDRLEKGEFDSFLDLPIAGKATLTDLTVKQTVRKDDVSPAQLAAADRPYVTSAGSVAMIAAAEVTIDGPLRSPKFNGRATISNLDVAAPTIQPARSQTGESKFNPSFDFAVSLTNAGRIRTTTADLFMLGDAKMKGSVSQPNVQANFEVAQGSIRLPGGLVRIESGGSVNLSYDGSIRDSQARMIVDLIGNTSLTAARTSDQIERYDISMTIRGDLLRDNGLQLAASSDPPDLNQETILQMLGRTDLIASFSGSGNRSDTQRQLRDALAGYALPTVLEPLTRQFASGLGLDYLSLEYNTFDQASIAFGKLLGKGFSVQGVRQLSEPPPGFAQRFDLRIVYRPHWRGNRFRISVGMDEQRPWKIAFDYGLKF